MVKNYLKFENLKSYKASRELSRLVWSEVIKWDYLSKKSIGDQFIRSIDSIGANIAEGLGRYHKKDKIKFYYNARGSVFEAMHWLDLALERKLISKEIYNKINEELKKLPLEINYLIKITNDKLSI